LLIDILQVSSAILSYASPATVLITLSGEKSTKNNNNLSALPLLFLISKILCSTLANGQ